ncbi:hypothetical protein PHYBLDRAFT_68542 [Phycomyces blakesleeanus NRRL 1555(-)]|uniref:Uncharacterized protein n=1 Tax=Phycomyces blakesleeanus (strain ATCC 8743b / DSM 1359 / FGSC 10004 / NBRC 33097 / NRRL 1555) TaxID=763407 RepID=A0A163ECK3_PHYB8|nr:hypothetical protein PHYBLDRAFT_68542 [Phycomyces blakesleeanus NRRL 1555(-)]OAD77960.1 hypothetical protein PHYBLDRAFT_68542 [Phycomyces blakesleeanus NRRL 1555(-)]|eukprot:XP_018296000.1 hypothetical protein PHYBLDRAFT_68542 [Phycomyces blakesleeanus NRRL 1555(-)]
MSHSTKSHKLLYNHLKKKNTEIPISTVIYINIAMIEEIPCLIDEFGVVVEPAMLIEYEDDEDEGEGEEEDDEITLENYLWSYTEKLLFDELPQIPEEDPADCEEPDTSPETSSTKLYTSNFCHPYDSSVDLIVYPFSDVTMQL